MKFISTLSLVLVVPILRAYLEEVDIWVRYTLSWTFYDHGLVLSPSHSRYCLLLQALQRGKKI